VPPEEIQLVATDLPAFYLEKALEMVGTMVEEAPKHVELHLMWCLHLFTVHGKLLQKKTRQYHKSLRVLQRRITTLFSDLSSVSDGNAYTMQYLRAMMTSGKALSTASSSAS
tara:strand:+ start:268 stop:603 length:336 start_codon:yes stop_codon:yes gene_type:complete